MPITDKNAVFIIGAGSSAIFGMPLGGNLIEDIATQINKETKRSYKNQHNRIVSSLTLDHYAVARASQGEVDYDKYSIASAEYLHLKSDGAEQNLSTTVGKVRQNLLQLMALLKNQTSDTIDDFIVENEEVARLTKVCIATMFLRSLYKRNEGSTTLSLSALDNRNFIIMTSDRKKLQTERNWIHHFINLVRKAVQSGDVSPENKVKVISFNYDNILEHVLTKQFQNTGYEYEAWDQYIEIIHPHGQCGLPPETIENPAALAIEWAKGIFVVNEQIQWVSEQVISDREKAKEWIAQSDKIYSLGFAFSGPNLRLLGLDPKGTPQHNRIISYCNYDGNVGLRRSLLRFERENKSVLLKNPKPNKSPTIVVSVEIEEAKGEGNKPMGCSDWFKLGYPGELPS